MKIRELIAMENDTLEQLRTLLYEDKNPIAGQVILGHLREVSKSIDEWKKEKDKANTSAHE